MLWVFHTVQVNAITHSRCQSNQPICIKTQFVFGHCRNERIAWRFLRFSQFRISEFICWLPLRPGWAEEEEYEYQTNFIIYVTDWLFPCEIYSLAERQALIWFALVLGLLLPLFCFWSGRLQAKLSFMARAAFVGQFSNEFLSSRETQFNYLGLLLLFVYETGSI